MILLILVRILITALVVVFTAHWIPGLVVLDIYDLIFFGLTLGLINVFIRPIITFLTLPINIITLGLFTLVINAFTFWLAAEITYGIYITTFWGAFWGGIIIWFTGFITNQFLWTHKRH